MLIGSPLLFGSLKSPLFRHSFTPCAAFSHPPAMQDATPEEIDAFVTRWEKSGGHERGSSQQFLLEFCQLLGLEKPAPPVAENERNAYTFERRVDRKKPDGSSAPNWIDLYKSTHFVLETKQGVNPRRDKSAPDQSLLPHLFLRPRSLVRFHPQSLHATLPCPGIPLASSA